MRCIKMDFVRDGSAEDVLSRGRRYYVVIDSKEHRQFDMPLGQAEFLDLLADLRYQSGTADEQRKQSLEELSKHVTTILQPPVQSGVDDLMQLDLVTSAHELWALPFEATLAGNGKPLLATEAPAFVLTRRIPQEFADRKPDWPARPRILFAHATPDWLRDAEAVPASTHKKALLAALQPWVQPFENLPEAIPQEESVLTTLANASLESIKSACQQAWNEKKPYTHVHLLAHGVLIQNPRKRHRTRYGVALRSETGEATLPEDLADALRPSDAQQDLPVVVTLAICDGANVENSIVESGGIAQELHRAGVPIVVASQLPLTFRGSEIMTTKFYRAWMDGKDVREALHLTRVALYDAEQEDSRSIGHDWLSLVSYVRLPEGYSDYLLDVRLRSELVALENASRYARHLVENNIKNPGQYDQVAVRLQTLVDRLEQLLKEHDKPAFQSKGEIAQENAGLLGSAYKRLAELLAWRAAAEPEQRVHWIAESVANLGKARDAYRRGFERNSADHWCGAQYLALEAVLTGQIAEIGLWYACHFAAVSERKRASPGDINQIWALGSITELVLLAPLADGLKISSADAAALVDLCELANRSAPSAHTVHPTESTRRQLMRYIDWWTKPNGFFEKRDHDFALEAAKLVQIIDKSRAAVAPSR